MPAIIPDRQSARAEQDARPSLWKRLGWFAILYAAGVGSVGLVAFGLRLWIKS